MFSEDFIVDIGNRMERLQSMATEANHIIGYPRPSAIEARQMTPPARESAVLFPLFLRDNRWHTAFMKRPSGQGVHSDQLSFPGGKLEIGESHLQAALREAQEEIGLESGQWNVIGQLSTLYIPPSHFVVQPFLAWAPGNPQFQFNTGEVAEWIEHPIDDFMHPNLIGRKEIFVAKYNRTFDSGYFNIQGHTLWGATAIMVQEFRSLFGYEN